MSKNPLEHNVTGISPLGGNSVEGASTGYSEIKDASVQAVPLVYDSRVNAWISEQAVEELDDREASLEKSQIYREEEQFRAKIGYRRSY